MLFLALREAVSIIILCRKGKANFTRNLDGGHRGNQKHAKFLKLSCPSQFNFKVLSFLHVWSLTQCYSVGFSQSRIHVINIIFSKTRFTSDVFDIQGLLNYHTTLDTCPGISEVLEATHKARLRVLEGHISSKSPSRVRD